MTGHPASGAVDRATAGRRAGLGTRAPGSEPFGVVLRRLRLAAGLTQEQLAEAAGLTPHAVGSLERGARTRPHPHTVRSLAAGLGVDDEVRATMIAAVPRRPGPGANQGRADAAPPAAALSVPATPVVGRERDVEAVLALLVDRGQRLVTLTGTGGVGKTRLAVAVAERAATTAFPDGVHAVPLASASAPEEVLPAVARALGVERTSPDDPLDDLVRGLAGRRCLVVLDNLEHLLGAAEDVAALVQQCPSLTVLTTSRAPLRLRGEVEHAVAPLGLPDGDDVESVGRSPAAALLLARARTHAPSFGACPEQAPAVAALCRRLAGIPLALELTAARARDHDAEELLRRWDAGSELAAPADLPERQRTMRATLAWSCGLLSPAEQRVLRILAVFAGPFDLAAAESVAGGDVLVELEALVEHSLVTVVADGRFVLLEPIAEHARALLAEQERAAAHRAHAAWALALAERGHDGYAGAQQLDHLDRTERAHPDLLLAVERSLTARDTRTAARLCWELQRFWWFRQRTAAGRRLTERVLAACTDPADRALAALAAGCLALALDDLPAAQRHWDEATALADTVAGVDVRAHAGAGLGLLAFAAGDLERARTELDLARRRTTTSSRGCCTWLHSMCLIWSGSVRAAEGDLAGARASVEQGLAAARGCGDRLAAGMALYALASQDAAQGDRQRARDRLVEGVRLAGETRDALNVARFLQSIVVLDVEDGQPRSASVLVGAAEALLETAGAAGVTYRLLDPGDLARACARARDLLGPEDYDDAVDLGRGLDLDELVDRAGRGMYGGCAGSGPGPGRSRSAR